jgi:ABC-2 type transport system permease protein
MRTAYVIWKKYMIKMSMMELVGMLIQPVLWILLFSGGMQGMLGAQMGAGKYLTFMLPGIMALTIIGGAITGGSTWLTERTAGLVREYWVAPVSRSGILLGNTMSTITKSLLQTAILVIVGILAGAAFDTSVPGILGSLTLIIIFCMGFGGIALSMACSTDNTGVYHSMIMLLNLPLLFLSNALYSFDAMPGWMRVASKINPTSYLVDGIRQMSMGVKGDFPLWICFAVVSVFCAIFVLLSVNRFQQSQK